MFKKIKDNKIDRDPNRGENYPGKLPDRHNLVLRGKLPADHQNHTYH